MATCDSLEADLSRTDYSVTWEQQPCIDAQILQPDITIQAVTLANQGPQGEAATIMVGTTTTTAPGNPASVVNVGTANDAIFNFGIPTGNTGPPGSAGTPGAAATIAAGTTTTTAPGTNATVSNSGTSNAAIFDFGIPRGNVGPQGQGLTPKGTVANSAALPATGNTTGDLRITLDTGHGWSWNGTTWVDMGPFQGPVGATGSQGPPGAPGSQGPAGATGSAGPAGTAATATAGTTTTGSPGTSANVVNAGTTSAAVFNFTIPRGDVGATGTTGSQGPQGIPGAAGPTGPTGTPAWTTNTSGFTIPAVGSTVSVTVADASWIVVGEMLYVDQAGGGAGLSGILQVTAKAGNTLTLLNPQPAPAIPLADSTQSGLLKRLSGNAIDYVGGDNNCHALIWDPANGLFFQDDFTLNASSGPSGIGYTTSSGTGGLINSNSVYGQNATLKILGSVELITGNTAATTGAGFSWGGNMATPYYSIVYGLGAALTFKTRVFIEASLPATAFGYAFRTGIAQPSGTLYFNQPQQGFFFEYSPDQNSGQWRVGVGGGSITYTNTSVMVAFDTAYNLEIDVNAAWSSIKFLINGTIVATVTTGIPTTSGLALWQYAKGTTGSASQKAAIDSWMLYYPVTR